MTYQYILEGHNAVRCDDTMTWAKWFEANRAKRHVRDETIGGVRVSTVFLGIDHQYGNGPPLLFETMVFGGDLDEEMDRYSTWEDAEHGHAAMVERVRGKKPR